MEKTGQVEPEDISNEERIIWGHKLEELVAQRFCEITGKRVRKKGLLRSYRKPFMQASLDREIIGENAGLECKTCSGYLAREWEDDKIPDSYYAQVMHYLSVTGMDKFYIACLIGGNQFVWKEIPRNESDIEALEAMEEEFWNHVTDLTAPPLDGSDSCAQALREKFHGGIETPLELDAKAMDMVNQYRRLKEAADDIKDEMETIKNILCGTLGDYETAYAGDIKVSWKTQAGRTTIDSKKLKEEHPDIYEKYSKTGKPTRVFRIA
jgi:putative phage-type endonuclease